MAKSDPETIKIVDESVPGEQRHQLYIDGCCRAIVTKRQDNIVRINWQVSGPIQWNEGKIMMMGLIHLSMIAEELSSEKPRGKKKK